MITIALPDTLAMRNLLDQLAAHVADDMSEEAIEYDFGFDVHACDAFVDAVNGAIHPLATESRDGN